VNDAHAVGGVDDRLVSGVPAHAIALVTDLAEELDYLAATSRLSVNPTHFDAVADAHIAALLRGHEIPSFSSCSILWRPLARFPQDDLEAAAVSGSERPDQRTGS
jgi:hypothetical protein